MTLEGLRSELDGLDFVVGRELDREIHESEFHQGREMSFKWWRGRDKQIIGHGGIIGLIDHPQAEISLDG